MAVLDDPIQLFGDEAIQDPYPLYHRMRSEAPVHRIGQSVFYAVCSWDAVVECVNRADDFSSNLTATMVYQDDGTVTPFTMSPLDDPSHVLGVADDPAHAVHRKVLVPHLSAKRIRDIESFAAGTADRLWRESAHGGQIEWMSAMANRLPMMVVAGLIGVPDDDVDQLIRTAYAATTFLDGIVAGDQLQAAGVAAMELGDYVLECFEKAATDPADHLLGDLARRCASGDLDEATAVGMMVILFGAGGESTASLLGSAAWILATHPEIQREVRDNPGLLGPFIDEALRYEPPFRAHYRHVRNATSLAGVELPADAHLLLMWGAANRDPDHFESPDEFRLDRRTGKAHITFGKGTHFCVGAALARLEAQIVLGQLLERTSKIEAAEIGRWLPSLLVRRLEHLNLTVKL